MGRYEKMFEQLQLRHQGAFVPFVTLGDPTVETSLSIVRTLVESGADALELGIPFSDPIADGPTIQASAVRALDQGVTPGACIELLSQIRGEFPEIPIGLLLYANLVAANGIAPFFKRLGRAGVDSVLVADVPIFEAEPFVTAAAARDLATVFIAPPNATEERLRQIARMTSGYTYVVARAGVTGVDQQLQLNQTNIFSFLKDTGAPPSLVGFGISTPEHVRQVLAAGADGAISGSAVVTLISRHLEDVSHLKKELGVFVKQMKAAT